MSKEMNNLIRKMIKYDIIGGFIFLLIIFLIFNLKISLIFLLGLIVSLINAIVSGFILENSLKKGKRLLFFFSFLIRIIFILLIAFPFYSDFKEIVSYVIGYISHFIFLVISIFDKSFKESD
ncbi:ATP synthase subunit I [Clostridium sp.]|uniref:ATP synthase subunit I n=1 Tax=Clostridium sp. TaxID=1506 RepID=UPI002603F5A1|nr:ATP synthase subunit I [Clostridium sp.]